MARIQPKFRKAAETLGKIAPNVNDGFWNFYRNVGNGMSGVISQPVEFLKDGQVVAGARFESLGSAISLKGVAVKCIVADAARRGQPADWDHIRVSHGTPIPRADVMALIASDPVAKFYDDAPSSMFQAWMDMGEHLRAIDPMAQSPADTRTAYEQIKANFNASVIKAAHNIHWDDQNGLAARLRGLFRRGPR